MVSVYVSIGSNINREQNILSGIRSLRQAFGELQLSSIYDSEAVGFDGAAFYNLAAGFDTTLDVHAVVSRLRDIEDAHERRRDGPRFSSRTLDIDLLLYDDLVLDSAALKLPRAEILHNAFVLAPLAEIAPTLKHPEVGLTYAELWQRFDQDSQRLTRLDRALTDDVGVTGG
jgi:2-amino-4-hydroxy-6-hydroxymethyldihydropteridine diphosphokinase